jgi:hypothetical protein
LARWFVVVRRERRDLYRFMGERLEGVVGVEVMLDRRRGDRRRRLAWSSVRETRMPNSA